ncbi:unnamed protein product [Prorocentrum cordatum]|uniref:Uncharacterized protein n=1 Tax=Prorocentrum cordatum TaxID=2364126 RepID=A0ABN9TZ23_9DINO|nr:unnamed protein product [Polarella glacialis]
MTLVEEMDDQDALELTEVLRMPRGHAKKFRNQVQRLRDSTGTAAHYREYRPSQDDADVQQEHREEDTAVSLEGPASPLKQHAGRLLGAAPDHAEPEAVSGPAREPASARRENMLAAGTSGLEDVAACTDEQCEGSADANVTEEAGMDCNRLPPEEHAFNGQWLDNTDNCLVNVRGTEVHFQGVGTYLFEAVNDTFACYLLEDEVLEGQIGEGGALYWSDGAGLHSVARVRPEQDTVVPHHAPL